jgi:hypothetical protein
MRPLSLSRQQSQAPYDLLFGEGGYTCFVVEEYLFYDNDTFMNQIGLA